MPPIDTPIDTPRRSGVILVAPVAAATALFAGGLGARDALGNSVPASDTAGLVVLGRIQTDVDNSAGAAGDLSANFEAGVFRYANSAGTPLTNADVGHAGFVEDDETVSGNPGNNGIVAGLVVEVDADGVWIDTRYAAILQRNEGISVAVVDNADGTATATIRSRSGRTLLRVWLADTAYGAVDAAETSVAATTGSVITSHTAHGDLECLSDADGDLVLTITAADGALHVNAAAGAATATGTAAITGN